MNRSLISTCLAAMFGNLFKPEEPEAAAGLKELAPPDFLYIRVSDDQVRAIRQNGMPKDLGRYWLWTSLRVGGTLHNSTVLTIDARTMYRLGHKFWLSKDGSYTVREIPAQFIL